MTVLAASKTSLYGDVYRRLADINLADELPVATLIGDTGPC